MNVVVHWVDEPRLESKRHGVSVYRMLDMLQQTARRNGAKKFLFLTDQDTTEAAFPWATMRVKRKDANVMGHLMRARVQACDGLRGNTLFCDADTLINKPPPFEGEWSIAVPWFPKYNCGVILCRDIPYAKDFFQKSHDMIRDMEPCHRLFGGDQETTKQLIIKNDGGVRKLNRDEICQACPDTLEEAREWNPSGHILNFKGVRKRYMETVFANL